MMCVSCRVHAWPPLQPCQCTPQDPTWEAVEVAEDEARAVVYYSTAVGGQTQGRRSDTACLAGATADCCDARRTAAMHGQAGHSPG